MKAFKSGGLAKILLMALVLVAASIGGFFAVKKGMASIQANIRKAAATAQRREMTRSAESKMLFEAMPGYMECGFYVHGQIDAVLREITYPMQWFSEDKDMLRLTAKNCIADLKELRADLKNEKFPGGQKQLKTLLLDIIRLLEKTIIGIEKKDMATIEKEAAAVIEKREQLDPLLANATQKFVERRSFKAVISQEEAKTFDSGADRNDYLKALVLMDKYDFSGAYIILEKLLGRGLSAQAGAIVKVRMTDCIFNDYVPDGEDPGKAIQRNIITLESIIKEGVYFPGISDAYLKWRAAYQHYTGGPSNLTDIPNYFFNKSKRKAIQAVSDHISKNADDNYARYEYGKLLLANNILRGPMGNDSSLYFFKYYMRKLTDEMGLGD